jgi:hypothetical protein
MGDPEMARGGAVGDGFADRVSVVFCAAGCLEQSLVELDDTSRVAAQDHVYNSCEKPDYCKE